MGEILPLREEGASKIEAAKLVLPFPPPASRFWDEAAFAGHVRRSISRDGRIYLDQVRQAWVDAGSPSFGKQHVSVRIYAHHPDARTRRVTDLERIAIEALIACGTFDREAQFWHLAITRSSVRPGGQLIVHVSLFAPTAEDLF